VNVFLKTPVGFPEVYTLDFMDTNVNYQVVITVANFNVSAMLYLRDNPVLKTHHKTVKVVIIHPSGPQHNKATTIKAHFIRGQSLGYGNCNWMTSTEFISFFKDNMFTVGFG